MIRNKSKIEVWCFDEHRVGLKPIIKRVWSKIGQTPEAIVNPGFEWLYFYAFLHPASGRTHWVLLPRVDSEGMSIALDLFAREHVDFGRKEVLLVMDNAPSHKSMKTQWPLGVHPLFQPPYSPEVQPAERLWQFTDEPLVNKGFSSIEQIQDIAAERCVHLMDNMTDQIAALTNYHWWPEDAAPYIQRINTT